MKKLTGRLAVKWIAALADTFSENRERLTDMDRDIGDSDHGINISRGFATALQQVEPLADRDLGTIFKTVAMALISKVGGASGVLFGSFFLQAATKLAGKNAAGPADLEHALVAGLNGVTARGKAEIGDKTMIDALLPAVGVFGEAKGEGFAVASKKALEAARKGADSTKDLVAKKGRASYLGGRSAGHIDPGAESIVLLFQTLAELVAENSVAVAEP